MKRRMIALAMALVMVLCLVPTVAMAERIPFTASIGGQECTITKTEMTYTYTPWGGDPQTRPVYAVTVTASATSVDLNFGSEQVLVYNYTADGEWLSGFYASATATDPLYTGVSEQSVLVDANSDGMMDYIQVQDPYNLDYTGADLRYAITFYSPNVSTPSDATGSSIVPAKTAWEAYTKTGSMLMASASDLVSGSGQSDWKALGLARAGMALPQSYIDSAKENLSGPAPILALVAAGVTPSEAQLANMVKNYDYTSYITFASNELLALDACGYETPLRDTLISHMLNKQDSNGAWGYTWGDDYYADMDSTCMVIQALAPYYGADSRVTTAIDKALGYIKANQNPDGTFGAWSPSVETTAQVIVALTALGLDPDKYCDKSCIDGLRTLSIDNGGFSSSYNSDITNAQGYYALVAYYRYLSGKTSLYDMRQAKTAGIDGTLGNIESFTDEAVKVDLGSGKAAGMDAALVTSLKENTGNVKLEINSKLSGLNDAQKAVVGSKQVVNIDLSVGTTAITGALAGKLTVTIPADTNTAKTDGYRLVAKRVADDGSLTDVTCYYDSTGKIVLVLDHLSTYMIYTEAVNSGYHGYDTTGAQTVTTDLTAGSITKVTVDGKVVDSKNYTISGSNVTFTAAYLKTLANGKHAVAIENATHVAKATITVENGTTAVNSAKTGDMGVVIYFAMGAMSYIGSAAWIRKRKDEM